MKKMQCFLCGLTYDPGLRVPVITVHVDGEDEPQNIMMIRYDGKTMKLCPACVRAVSFGSIMHSQITWDGEIEYEEDVPDEELPPPETLIGMIDMDAIGGAPDIEPEASV